MLADLRGFAAIWLDTSKPQAVVCSGDYGRQVIDACLSQLSGKRLFSLSA